MEKQIIEGNRLIAEFEGFKSNVALQYHSSWDWIIPACKKWDDLYMEWTIDQMKEYVRLCDALDDIVAHYKIMPVFEQLVKCIEWYNKNK